MNKKEVIKGFKKVFGGIGICFVAPVIIMQAFKNQDHPMYWPVLIIGLILLFLAIGSGFIGVSTLVGGLFDEKKKKQD